MRRILCYGSYRWKKSPCHPTNHQQRKFQHNACIQPRQVSSGTLHCCTPGLSFIPPFSFPLYLSKAALLPEEFQTPTIRTMQRNFPSTQGSPVITFVTILHYLKPALTGLCICCRGSLDDASLTKKKKKTQHTFNSADEFYMTMIFSTSYFQGRWSGWLAWTF